MSSCWRSFHDANASFAAGSQDIHCSVRTAKGLHVDNHREGTALSPPGRLLGVEFCNRDCLVLQAQSRSSAR